LWSKVRRRLAQLSEQAENFRKTSCALGALSKQMTDKFVKFKACSQLFEINFALKTAQISGFQTKKHWVEKKVALF